jgi:PAS domain S-box-containing protein
VLVRDITERKELQSNLAAERDFLDQIMATSLSAIVVIDADGELSFANKAAERVLGVTASTATSRRFDHPAWRSPAPGFLETPQTAYLNRRRCRDG